ncbi:hypothetical protein [Streptomyces tanashiensis]|uniref:Uncharacterized protein n=1 Tax=Streptomyces tanashiensis TaxID=67367 RepID=A0ABY6QQ95_9ACTN|nr:hypothetical protein [Streptomyces tanashiensis]UZX19865.1 hypothetical protein LDH80_03615 [Streptomyces tanashiensis]GGY42228.1 hypothetical protein GCM10010299_55650 [Streptomyces tanashiensis]
MSDPQVEPSHAGASPSGTGRSSDPGTSGRIGTWPGGFDAAAWALADSATRRLALATLETLRARETATALATRYVNIGNAQRAGHLFEVMHALSFNLSAVERGSSVRAVVTEWAEGGSRTAPADLHLLQGGRLVGQAQAKLVESASATADRLARPHYDGMRRLVASDRLQAVEDLLDKRLTMPPEGLRYANYQDARAHVTDRLAHGGVSGEGISLDEAHRAARDPGRWADRQVARAGTRQMASAAGVAAGLGGIAAGVTEAARQAARVRAGETSASVAAFTAIGSAVRQAALSGGTAALGEAVRIGAAAGVLPRALGGGTLPGATAQAAFAVAEAGLDLARGDGDVGEFAARATTAVVATGLAWGCGAVGQTLLPVPVVGALVGGVVGQAAAAVIVQGLQIALVAARADAAAEARIQLLEREVATAVVMADALHRATGQLGEERNSCVAREVLPRFRVVRDALAGDRPDLALAELAELTRRFGGRPVYGTQQEFDAWMLDESATLVLDPNW